MDNALYRSFAFEAFATLCIWLAVGGVYLLLVHGTQWLAHRLVGFQGMAVAAGRLSQRDQLPLRGVSGGVIIATVGMALVQSVALALRYEPPIVGAHLQEPSYSHLVQWVGVALAAFYTLSLAIGALLAARAGRHQRRRAMLWTIGVIVLFLVLVFPLTEVMSACLVGRSLFLAVPC